MPGKDILLLFDGTWNDIEFGDSDTNIVRLYEMMAKTLARRDFARTGPAAEAARSDTERPLHPPAPVVPPRPPAAGAQPGAAAKAKPAAEQVHSYTDDSGRSYLVFYSRGVGTGATDRFLGGAIGNGLPEFVRRGYTFLSFHYTPGDRIFIFGFSRGSFAARSLTGYIGAAGLLRRDACTPELAEKAWRFYRTHPDDRLPGVWAAFAGHTHPRSADEAGLAREPVLQVACLAVFDTVGALGIPTSVFRKFNRAKYAFHNVELSSITGVNLQALAIDEQRMPFEAAVWRRPPFKDYDTCTEQVWFTGVHADIGGGYIDETDPATADKRGARLDDFSLDWMIKRLRHYFPGFPIDDLAWPPFAPRVAFAVPHNSRKSIYRVWRHAHRMIGNANDPRFKGLQRWRHAQVCRDRHAEPFAEMIHISALERLGIRPHGVAFATHYRPQNLVAVLDAILATYAKPELAPSSGLQIVQWDGTILRPHLAAHCADARRLVAEARQRLG